MTLAILTALLLFLGIILAIETTKQPTHYKAEAATKETFSKILFRAEHWYIRLSSKPSFKWRDRWPTKQVYTCTTYAFLWIQYVKLRPLR